jgi:hypothetical protein
MAELMKPETIKEIWRATWKIRELVALSQYLFSSGESEGKGNGA